MDLCISLKSMKTLCFALKDCSKSILERFCEKWSPKDLKYHYENKHFAIVRFHDVLSRTCIGDNGLRLLFGVFCEPLRSGLNPAYISKQKGNTSEGIHEIM